MSDSPRRRRANAWLWLYLALFESDRHGDAQSSTQAGDTAQRDSEESSGR